MQCSDFRGMVSYRHTWLQVPALPLVICVILVKFLINLSELQFPYLWNGDDNNNNNNIRVFGCKQQKLIWGHKMLNLFEDYETACRFGENRKK